MKLKKIIIINGFLGSGKTTFVQNIIRYFQNIKIGLIINEFGDFSIDDKLIDEINVTISEIHSGSIFCSCKEEEFIVRLTDLINKDIELIIVESSGFSNPTSLDRIMNYVLSTSNINVNIIKVTICDAKILHKIINTLSVIKKQIECSDIILLNKIDLLKNNEIENSYNLVKKINNNSEIICCSYCNINFSNLLTIKSINSGKNEYQIRDISLKSISIKIIKKQKIEKIIDLIEELKKYVFRVKGFVEVQDAKKYYFDLASEILNYHITNIASENKLIVLYSSKIVGLNKIKDIIYKYLNNDFVIKI